MNTSTLKKSRLTLVYALGTALLCGAARAEEPVGGGEGESPEGWNYEPGEGLSFGEQPVVSAEFSLSLDSKYLTYGLIDNDDPILTPAGSLTFFDWVTIGVSAIFDTTRYGEGAGYHSRRWQYVEVDPEISIGHKFSHLDWEAIPVCLGTIEWSVGYLYEHDPVSMNGPYDADEDIDEWEDLDTQYLTAEIGLPDLWFEPKFSYEKDFMRDHGTYLNVEVGHTFAIFDSDASFAPSFDAEEDSVVTFRLSLSQGWGDRRRVSGYYLVTADGDPLERNGLMDTQLKGELSWAINDYLSLSGYLLYSDYVFDRHTREAARRYEGKGDYKYSYNFVCGLCLTASF